MISVKDFLKSEGTNGVLVRDLETGLEMGKGSADGLIAVEFEDKEIVVVPDIGASVVSPRKGFAHYTVLGLCPGVDERDKEIIIERIKDPAVRDQVRKIVSQLGSYLVVFAQDS